MRVFLDFEASSLGKWSYPIEVAWVFEDGRGESHLIRPAPGWTDWDDAAEAIHRIPRRLLERQGEPHEQVAARMVEQLSSHALHASAPSWDAKWLNALLRTCGYPKHHLRLRKTADMIVEDVAEILGETVPPAGRKQAAAAVLAEVFAAETDLPAHRALPDARAELQRWKAALGAAEALRARSD